MKSIPLILTVLAFTVTLNMSGQDFDCLTDDGQTSLQSSYTLLSTNCPLTDLTDQEIQDLPNITIYVNVHFVGSQDGNFYPGADNDYNRLNGNKFAELMLQNANNELNNLISNPIAIDDFLGDARYNYELYTDSNNPNDLYGVFGIGIHFQIFRPMASLMDRMC